MSPALLVGVTTYNDEGSIGGVVSAAQAGVSSELPGVEGRILLADGGSSDRTVQRAREAFAPAGGRLDEASYTRQPSDLLSVPYHGLPGRAQAIRTVMNVAHEMGVQACVLLDGAITSTTASWTSALARPVLDDAYDYAAPLYDRHAYDGALTKGLLYPLLRALYGVRLRQPAAGELACSARVIDACLQENMWDWEGAQAGVDIWLTTIAMTGGFAVCEVPLGRRSHRPRGEEGLDLGVQLNQVVGAVFADLEERADTWQRVRGSSPVPLMQGLAHSAPVAPRVEAPRLIEAFRLGYRELRDVWSTVLPPKTIIELRRAYAGTDDRFVLPDDLWARVVYDFALGYHQRALPFEHLFGSLAPLYLGWLGSFILQIPDASVAAADTRIEQLAMAFEHEKAYLVSRWRWPDRFRT